MQRIKWFCKSLTNILNEQEMLPDILFFQFFLFSLFSLAKKHVCRLMFVCRGRKREILGADRCLSGTLNKFQSE